MVPVELGRLKKKKEDRNSYEKSEIMEAKIMKQSEK